MNKTIRATTVLLVFITFMSFYYATAQAQFITGKWYGTSDITSAPGYHLSSTEEKGDILQISGVDSNKISGVSYHYYWFRGNFYYYVKDVECTYDVKANEWMIKETGIKDNQSFSGTLFLPPYVSPEVHDQSPKRFINRQLDSSSL